MEKQERGFTLVELVISVAIFAVIILATMGTYDVGQDVCSLGCANLTAQSMNTNCLSKITRTMRQGRVISVSPTGEWVTLQVPVDVESNGDIVDHETNEVTWGADGQKDWVLRYSYVETGTFDENTQGKDGIDANRDGDKRDLIGVGCLVEQVLDDTGTVRSSRQITPMSIVATTPLPGGDVNSDGEFDPLFERVNRMGEANANGANLRISLFTFREANKDRSIFLHPTSIVAPRNFAQ